jgi:hypothetical protein
MDWFGIITYRRQIETMARIKEIEKKEELPVEERKKFNGEGGEEYVDDKGLNMVEERKELVEDLFEKVEGYIKTNVELIKLRTIEKLSVVIASLASQVVLLVLFSFFFLMVNIGLAMWLGQVMGQVYYGFFLIAGIYALLSIILFMFRDSIIKNPIVNSIISQFLK